MLTSHSNIPFLAITSAGNATCTDLGGGAADESGRECVCTQGYGGDACTQIDACETSPCSGSHTTCRDLPPPSGDGAGGRDCVPSPGYQFNAAGATIQINACITSPCGSFTRCTDLNPPAGDGVDGRRCTCTLTRMVSDGTSCDCEVGYILEEGRCVNANACAEFPCSARASSRNVRFVDGVCADLPPPAPGNTSAGRTCSCAPPFVGDGEPTQLGCGCINGLYPNDDDTDCIPPDSCVIAPCGAAETCVQIPGGPPNANGRRCTCSPDDGYTGGTLNLQTGELMPPCVNINACASFPCPVNGLGCQDLPPPASNSTSGRWVVASPDLSLSMSRLCF